MFRVFKLLIPALLVAFMSGACLPEKENKVPEKKPVSVTVMDVKTRDLPLNVEAVGRLNANREVTLAAEVGGVIKSYTVDVGDEVKLDQEVVKIDPTDYRLALNEARAGLASARAGLDAAEKAFKRTRQLLPRKVISQDAFDRSEAEYKSARAAAARARALVDISRERLGKTSITAPFPGLIAARHIEIGQTVSPGMPAMKLVDLSLMRVKLHVAEKDYVNLDFEDPVAIILEAFPEKKYQGRIDRIGIQADPGTNTFEVDILVENPNLELKAGLTARVRIITRIIPQAVLIPQSAVLYRENRREVFIVGPDGKAIPRNVELGINLGAEVQIISGLEAGDRLITAGGQYLEAGDSLSISVSGVIEAQ